MSMVECLRLVAGPVPWSTAAPAVPSSDDTLWQDTPRGASPANDEEYEPSPQAARDIKQLHASVLDEAQDNSLASFGPCTGWQSVAADASPRKWWKQHSLQDIDIFAPLLPPEPGQPGVPFLPPLEPCVPTSCWRPADVASAIEQRGFIRRSAACEEPATMYAGGHRGCGELATAWPSERLLLQEQQRRRDAINLACWHGHLRLRQYLEPSEPGGHPLGAFYKYALVMAIPRPGLQRTAAVAPPRVVTAQAGHVPCTAIVDSVSDLSVVTYDLVNTDAVHAQVFPLETPVEFQLRLSGPMGFGCGDDTVVQCTSTHGAAIELLLNTRPRHPLTHAFVILPPGFPLPCGAEIVCGTDLVDDNFSKHPGVTAIMAHAITATTTEYDVAIPLVGLPAPPLRREVTLDPRSKDWTPRHTPVCGPQPHTRGGNHGSAGHGSLPVDGWADAGAGTGAGAGVCAGAGEGAGAAGSGYGVPPEHAYQGNDAAGFGSGAGGWAHGQSGGRRFNRGGRGGRRSSKVVSPPLTPSSHNSSRGRGARRRHRRGRRRGARAARRHARAKVAAGVAGAGAATTQTDGAGGSCHNGSRDYGNSGSRDNGDGDNGSHSSGHSGPSGHSGHSGHSGRSRKSSMSIESTHSGSFNVVSHDSSEAE